MDSGPRVLIAAPLPVVRELGGALGAGVEIISAQTRAQAVERLQQENPDLIIVCYAFDEVYPFRFLDYVKHEWDGNAPRILVRALPVRLGATQEAQIGEAYKSLGVNDFFNLYDEGERIGRAAALAAFRDVVFDRLALVRGPSNKRASGPDRA